MSKKEKNVPTMESVTQKATTVEPIIGPEIAKLLPKDDGLFAGGELQDSIQMEEGMGFRTMFVGKGPDMEFDKADGQGKDIVATWRFKFGKSIVPIRGATHLDKQMIKVVEDYKVPCMVAVEHQGQMDLQGGAKRMFVYHVAAFGERKPDSDVF